MYELFLTITVVIYIVYYIFYPVTAVQRPIRSKPIGKKPEGSTAPYRRVGYDDKLVSYKHDDCRTLPQLIERSYKLYGNRQALGCRTTVKTSDKQTKYKNNEGKEVSKTLTIQWQTDYKWLTYKDTYDQIVNMSKGLTVIGHDSNKIFKQNDKVAIYMSTRPEWITTSHAAWFTGLQVVTCYPSLGPDALLYSLQQCDVSLVFTELKLLSQTLHKIIDKLDTIHTVVYADNYDDRNIYHKHLDELKQKHSNIKFIKYNDLIELGKNNKDIKQETHKPDPDDIAVIMYTSGSTGNPKVCIVLYGYTMLHICYIQLKLIN